MSDDIISYGATLARRMDRDHQARHLGNFDADRAKAVVHLVMVPGLIAGQSNVEVLIDVGTPDQAVDMVRVADTRLSKLYAIDGRAAPLLDPIEAAHVRETAESLVNKIRAASLGSATGRYHFDLPLEAAIREVVAVLAMATVTPAKLREDA